MRGWHGLSSQGAEALRTWLYNRRDNAKAAEPAGLYQDLTRV